VSFTFISTRDEKSDPSITGYRDWPFLPYAFA
jgi:hypothetical protein